MPIQTSRHPTTPLTCYVIGQDNVLIECVNIIRSRSFLIKGIISPSDQIKQWAQAQGVTWFHALKDVNLQADPADYLFSIVNNEIIPGTVLSQIRRLAINYHDGPLPRYAGSNATSWAILNGESQHAVTWHVINKDIDAGDILKQRAFPMQPDETVLSLNLKCVEHAIGAFAELLDELPDETYQRSPQDLSQRTYFYRAQKPDNNGWINWDSDADQLERLIRATHFGHYRNPFAVAKFQVNDDVLIVGSLTVLSDYSNKPPGTLLEIAQEYLTVATQTKNVKLSALRTSRAKLIDDLETYAYQHKLNKGTRLPSPQDNGGELLKTFSEDAFPHESRWIKTLSEFRPTATTSKQTEIDLTRLPSALHNRLGQFSHDAEQASLAVLTAWLVYLRRFESQTELAISVAWKETDLPTNVLPFFAQYTPISVTIDDQNNFHQTLIRVHQEVEQVCRQGRYLIDCWYRYPELTGLREQDEGYQIMLGAIAAQDDSDCTLPKPFLTLLDELLVHAQQPIQQIEWVTPAERQQLLFEWNATDAPYPDYKTIHRLFEEQVEITPDHVAIIAQGAQLTYRELNQRANQLAHHLLACHAIQPDQLIAVCLERSEWMLIALLGILKSGAGYVPIDPTYPDNRIRYIANETNAKVIITTQEFAERLFNLWTANAESVSPVVLNDTDFLDKLRHQSAENPITEVRSRHLAYVMYTSGTTGTPKGIQIEHRSIVNRIIWMNRIYPLSPSDKVMQKTPYVFDVSVWELFWPNWTGATVVFAKPDGHRNLDYLAQLIHDEEISILHFTPTMLNGFVQSMESDSSGSRFEDQFKHLRHLFCSGEALHDSTVAKARILMPHVRIHNLYGPTEAAIDVLYHECVENKPVCLGKPISNTRVYVLDKDLCLLPPGITGELYLAGDGLARGYLNQATLTRQQFIPNPFQTELEKREQRYDRLYKTADLVRWLPDGSLDYIGRTDRQIKLRGNRIELGEIEQVIQRFPTINQSAVVVRDNQLIAYYTSSQAIENEHVRLHTASWLPDYMRPDHWVCMDALPTGISGKVDYKQLPDPVQTKSAQFVSPRNAIETTIAMVFSMVLGIDQSNISRTDDFFNLGGDSILAIRLVARINELLNQRIQVRQVFELKTVQALSALIEQTEPTFLQPETPYQPFSLIELNQYQDLLSQHEIDDIYPASRLQIGMLLESSLNDYGTYHDVFYYEINRPFVEEKFLKIWETLANKHALLRARFLLNEQHALDVVIFKKAHLHYRFHVDRPLRELIDAERIVHFAHTEECLFHLIVNQHDDNFELIFSFHHAIVDGWSVASLINEFVQVYAYDQPVMSLNGTRPTLTYGEFVRNELCRLDDQDSIAFWKKYLDDAKPAHASWKFDDVEKSPDGLFTYAFHLTPDEAKQTRQLARYNAISIDTVFLVAYMKTLSFFMNSDDITIGILFNNRLEKVGGDTLFGLFLNVLPFRYKRDQNQSLQNELRATFSNKIKLLAHKHIPYAQLKSIFGYSLYEFGFNFNHFHILDQSDSVITRRGGFDRSSVPFVLEVTQTDTFKIDLKSHDDYVSQEYLNYFGNYLKLAIQNILHDKNKLQLNAKDYQKLIIDWNVTERSFPLEKTLHTLFEEQVERTPDAVALVFEDKKYTYEALNQHANQLAHYLREQYRIEKEELIALCLDRNELAVIAILAVLKSGAAYVPIEPGNPDDRISSILRECRPKVILSNVLYKLRLESFTQYELCEVLPIDDALNTKEIQKCPCTNLDVRMDGCHLAYVLYTSGTTGTPVGVMVEHRGVVNLVFEMIRRDNLCQNKHIAIYFSFAFDASVHELFPALLSGCQTFLLSNHVRYDLHSLCDYFQRHAIQNSAIPTSLISEFIQTCRPGELECIYTGADKLMLSPDVDPEKLPYSLINEYGPTEATVCTTFKRVSKEATGQIRTNNIGTPLPNVHCYVVDADVQPVPVGVIGELGISGVNLARGYLNNPALTAHKFIANPFQTNQEKNQGIHTVLYKSGDLVRWLPNGDLEFIARNDKQTKIRGNRVDLNEIENVMMTFPKVKQCAVLAISGEYDSTNIKPHTSLVAYYVKNDQVMNDESQIEYDHSCSHTTNFSNNPLLNFRLSEDRFNDELVSHLEKYLPNYLIPSHFIPLKKFPLNSNGKLNRNLLPEPIQGLGGANFPPTNHIEFVVRDIFAQVLRMAAGKIGIKDDFFALGGDSLLVFRVLLKINQYFGCQIHPPDFFANRSVGKLAKCLVEVLRTAKESNNV